jgi:solute carrier family 8 (sodium/calcium exchanger)
MAIGKATPISLIVVLLALAATSTHGQIVKTCGSGACCKEKDLIATETSDDATINAIQLKQYAYVSQADSAVNDTCYGMVHLKEFGSGHMILAFKAKETLCGNGLFLPIFPGEIMWSRALRLVLYTIALAYCFLGVAIIADKFMVAIEVITSKEKTMKIAVGNEMVEYPVLVWNATLANLTLMALGSSAPEILLAVIETVSTLDSPPEGGLGPSCIVGSAAFNLLAISAICVIAIPDGEKRVIKQYGVFLITAFFSVFAYIWMLVVLQFSTPNVVDMWEAWVTLLMFPLLAGLAFGQDKKWSFDGKVAPVDQKVLMADGTGESTYSTTGIAKMLKDQADGENSLKELAEQDPEALAKIAAANVYKEQRKSHMHYRINATRRMAGGQRVVMNQSAASIAEFQKAKTPNQSKDSDDPNAYFSFAAPTYEVNENEQKIDLIVLRSGNTGTATTVDYETSNGTAIGGMDFEYTCGTLRFDAGVTEMTVSVPIIDDNEYEPDENFYVSLRRPGEGSKVGAGAVANVTIINDDDPGTFEFDPVQLVVAESCGFAEISVARKRGSDGTVKIDYVTVEDSAIEGQDYTASKGTLVFNNGETKKMIKVPITNQESVEKNCSFKVQMEIQDFGQPDCGANYADDKNVCAITISNDADLKKVMDQVGGLVADNLSKFEVGSSTWKEQILSAIAVEGEDGEEPGDMDYFMHFLTFGWKIIFSLVPPTDYGGGWVCFFCSLGMIGVVTIFVGDIADIFGCLIGLPKPVTAITFVALGTSLPDTFASMQAATEDEYADASIGNVTGSNSVNVFLGLGLPWVIAALYKSSKGLTYIVEAGDLAFSVIVFCICALTCLATFTYRRVAGLGELGGPQPQKKLTGLFFFLLWCVYVLCSALYSLGLAFK